MRIIVLHFESHYPVAAAAGCASVTQRVIFAGEEEMKQALKAFFVGVGAMINREDLHIDAAPDMDKKEPVWTRVGRKIENSDDGVVISEEVGTFFWTREVE